MVHLRQFKVYLEEKSQMWNAFVAFLRFPTEKGVGLWQQN